MNIVITMGGLGKRFLEAGYQVPKYKIVTKGKTLFEWSMMSLSAFYQYNFIFLVRREDDSVEFIQEKCSHIGVNCQIIELEKLTRGQAETAFKASSVWHRDKAVLIYNIDTYVEPNVLSPMVICGDGYIPCFSANGSHWSFVRLGPNGKAIEVREKYRISNHCSLGAYYFKTGKLYEKIYKEFYADELNLEKGEQYIAPMYNLMIQRGMDVYIQNIPAECVHVLGTPQEVDTFSRTKDRR